MDILSGEATLHFHFLPISMGSFLKQENFPCGRKFFSLSFLKGNIAEISKQDVARVVTLYLYGEKHWSFIC